MSNRFLRILDHPVVFQPEDVPVTHPDPNCGVKGKRSSDYPCEGYEPTPNATFIGLYVTAPGNGSCDSDGHYLCNDCIHLSRRAYEEKTEYR